MRWLTPLQMEGATMRRREDSGFTLVELVVVVAIVAVLLTIGLVSYRGVQRQAEARGVHLDLITAVKVQALIHLETGSFNADAGTLTALEPNLQYSLDGANGTIVVASEAGREDLDVCVFAKTQDGTWFSMYHSSSASDRYGQSAPLQCIPANVAAWPTESW